MRAGFGNGGWVAIDGLGLPGLLYVRMRERHGRLRVSELYLDTSADPDGSITNRDVRNLNLTRIEALINQSADRVNARTGLPSPDLSVLASYYSTSFGKQEQQIREGNWVVASFASQYLPPEVDTATTEAGTSVMQVKPQHRQSTTIRESTNYRLSSGPTDGLTDDFLRDVARAYAAAVARGERPNVAIAGQVNYPRKTVQRWVYTARLRGLMPRGSKGRPG